MGWKTRTEGRGKGKHYQIASTKGGKLPPVKTYTIEELCGPELEALSELPDQSLLNMRDATQKFLTKKCQNCPMKSCKVRRTVEDMTKSVTKAIEKSPPEQA